MLTFIYVYNTLLELGKYYCFLGKLVLHYSNTFQCLEKIMHSLEIKSEGSLNYFTKELRWFFILEGKKREEGNLFVIYYSYHYIFLISFFFSTMCQIDYFVS